MLALPWAAAPPSDLNADLQSNSNPRAWGAGGSNDTGWVTLDATGADPANSTMAYADWFLDFAPGAEISNLTFEISVDGSEGYWATEPQITLMDTQTPILDWRGYGDLGRQDSFTENQPEVEDGELDTWLQPNSVSDASWLLPSGINIEDLVIESLRPADPRVSFSTTNVIVHDTVFNPIDGRLYILLDDDLLHLDDQASKKIVDIESDLYGRSLAVDETENRLLIGTDDGRILSRSLADSSDLTELPDTGTSTTIDAIAVDDNGVVWAATACELHHLAPGQTIYTTTNFCTTDLQEVPTDIVVISNTVYLATSQSGVRLFDYSTSTGSGTSVTMGGSTQWTTANNLTANSISQLLSFDSLLLIATIGGGVNRYDTTSDSWLTSWSTNNWLSSNVVKGFALTDGWLHVLAGNNVHAYDTVTLMFKSQRQVSDMGLVGTGSSIFAWPSDGFRSPDSGLMVVGDGSGAFARQSGENLDGTLTLVSSPSTSQMEVVTHIDDGEDGEIWISGGDIIDRFDNADQTWKSPIDLTDYVSNPNAVTSIVQDSTGWVWVGTLDAGVLRFKADDGSYVGSVSGISSTHVSSMSHDENTEILVIGHYESGISMVNTSTVTLVDVLTTSDGLDSDIVVEVATRYGIAYIATPDAGVMRVDLYDQSILGSWQSLGADNLDATPVAVDDDIIYLGLSDFGLLLIDRLTGDISGFWNQDDGTLPDDDVLSLHIDFQGDLLVGASVSNTGATGNGGISRWDGTTWQQLETSIPGWNNDPYVFYDITSDSEGIYAGTNRGACVWNWTYDLKGCISNQDGMPSRFVYSIAKMSNNRIYAGTNDGAAVIDSLNGSVIEVWNAGDDTQRARTVKIGDILYIGFENTGIARYDLINQSWLQAWDGSQGYISDDDVTALVPGRTPGTMWAGGDFGLTLIDVVNDTVLKSWNRGNNQNGPTLSNSIPADIVIIGDILHYSLQRSNSWWASNDDIYRIYLDNNTSATTLAVDSQIGHSSVVMGIGAVGEELWVGARPTQYWNNGDGTIIRWNATNESWEDSLETIGNVLRVNARFLGDCFPIDPASCEMWVAYGDNIMRRFQANNMTLLDEWTDIEGPIRGMVEWNGTYLFASMNGILRWDPVNEVWLDSWVEGDGLPSGTSEELYTMEVVGNNLWVGSYEGGGWNPNSDISMLDGSTDNWSSWSLGSGDIPGGYPADIEFCSGIIHVAIGRVSWWGNQGGVARFDTADWDGDGVLNEWVSPMTDSSQGLSDDDPRALACDQGNDVLYIGYDTDGVGIDRYNYNNNQYLATLTSQDGVSEDRIFPGGMLHHNNVLLAAHQYDNTGGISRIVTSGTSTANGQILDPGMDGCSIERAPSSGAPVYAIGRSGQTTGLNRVDRLDSSGLIVSGFDELAGLTSGRIVSFESNATHVWVTLTTDANAYYGSSVLQGQILSNGSVRWEFGYNANQDVINSLQLDDDKLWVSTAGRGLWSIDLSNRIFAPTPAALHAQMDGMILENDGTMYVGLMGREGSAAGFQTFDTDTRTWSHGSLIAGLPSDIVRDFLDYGDHIMVATYGGIGLWNTTRGDWDDPITTIDGLPTPIIEHLFAINTGIQGNGTVLAGGSAGLTVLHQNNLSVLTTLNFGDGLIGNTVSGITFADATSRLVNNPDGSTTLLHHDAAVFISHNGQGSTRPGVAAWDVATDMSNGTYNIDMIPSNDVKSIATDDWGVHIATDSEPIVHWNATSRQMESGRGRSSLLTWPPFQLLSDGDYLAVLSPRGVDVIDSGSEHSRVSSELIPGISNGFLDDSGLYIIAQDGLHLYHPVESMREQETDHQRRASPLTALFAQNTWDITNTSRPGMSTVLVDDENSILIPQGNEQMIPTKLPLYTGALTLSAPQDGAWVWAQSVSLNYSGSWELASMNPNIESSFQSAISNLAPGTNSAQVHIRMQSPQNGSIQVRITYDWQRIEVPTEMTSFIDRPNDGGGVLEASWLPAEDAAWYAYRLYVWDSTDDPEWVPSQNDLDDFSTYVEIPYWSQNSATITTADRDGNTVSLSDGREYRAAIAIAYADGSVGIPIAWEDSATPTDEVPAPPEWLHAEAVSGGTPGTILMEWSPCTELDPDRTRIWAVQYQISNAIALTDHVDVSYAAGNNTVLQLEQRKTYWFASVCVDEAGQFDAANATVVGPVVTAGGLDDGIPPAPITDTAASDAPNDEGGRILVTWTPNGEEDCTYHTVYILPASGLQPPSIVDGWPVATYVSDCTTGEIVIDSIGENPLQNGVVYWIGVVASDDWGNENVEDVLVVEATPMSNIAGQGQPPDRVEGLSAWDHPEDDGTAIDILWNRSLAPDFSHYVIWVSDYPLDDLTEIWERCSDDLAGCGLLEIDQRQIGGALQLEITMSTALYGSTVESLTPQPIVPLTPLYVTITTHDIQGHVHLTDMSDHLVLVAPLDNRGDISPPNRIAAPMLEDRSPDDGDGMFVSFPESDASDLGEYRIYAAAGSPFSSLGNMEPAMTLGRDAEMPALLETLSDGLPLAPSVPIWVTVVAVDSSGNYWDTNLQATMISLVDENSLDPGLHLPEITGIRANWNPSGDHVEIRWDDPNDEQVIQYHVFVSPDPFELTGEAYLVGEIDDPTTMMILTDIDGEKINNAVSHWLAVVAFDGEVHRLSVDPLEIRPWSEASFGSSEGGEGGASDSWYDQLISGDLNTLVALVSAVMILIGALLFVKPRQQAAPEPWEMGALEVELEEQMSREAAGLTDEDEDLIIDDDSQTFTSSSDSELTIDEDADAPEASESVIDELLGVTPEDTDLDDLDDLADDLDFDDLGDMADDLDDDEDVDTSFLDDAL